MTYSTNLHAGLEIFFYNCYKFNKTYSIYTIETVNVHTITLQMHDYPFRLVTRESVREILDTDEEVASKILFTLLNINECKEFVGGGSIFLFFSQTHLEHLKDPLAPFQWDLRLESVDGELTCGQAMLQ